MFPRPAAGPVGKARRALAIVAALGAVAACGSTTEIPSTTEPVTGPGTVYALASVNGIALPVVFTTDTTQIEVRKGALTLSPDSTWILSLATRTTRAGGTNNGTSTYRGPYTRDGSTLQLKLNGAVAYSGSYSPNNVAVSAGGSAASERYVFVR